MLGPNTGSVEMYRSAVLALKTEFSSREEVSARRTLCPCGRSGRGGGSPGGSTASRACPTAACRTPGKREPGQDRAIRTGPTGTDHPPRSGSTRSDNPCSWTPPGGSLRCPETKPAPGFKLSNFTERTGSLVDSPQQVGWVVNRPRTWGQRSCGTTEEELSKGI